MDDTENDRENLNQVMAAEVERYEALVRLLKEDRVNVREVKWQKPWSDGCVCVSDPSKYLQRGLERLRQRHAAEDTVGRVRRWVIAVLWLSVFAGIVAGIAYGVSRTVD